MATLIQMASNLRSLKTSLKKSSNEISKEFSKRLLTHLVMQTPVDTSRALSNWIINLNRQQIPTGSIENYNGIPAYYPGNDGSTEQISEDMAIMVGETMINLKKPGKDIFIVNNISYMDYLNEGNSKQQNAFWINFSIMRQYENMKFYIDVINKVKWR